VDNTGYENALLALILLNVLVLVATVPIVVWAVRVLLKDPHRFVVTKREPGTDIALRSDFRPFPGYGVTNETRSPVRKSELLNAKERSVYFTR
jgi:hypothetical protein